MAWKDMNGSQRVVAVNIDIMRNKDFAHLGGITQVGSTTVSADTPYPTAGTNGRDQFYNSEFIKDMTRKQLRYLVAHEQLHKFLQHCTQYNDLHRRHPDELAQAIDYVVNGMIEEIDPKFAFVERPTIVPPLVNPKYAGMSVVQVVRDLLQQQKQGGGGGKGGTGQVIDVHIMSDESGLSQAEQAQAAQQVSDAMRQGLLVRAKLRGEAGSGGDLSAAAEDRSTDWRGPLQEFMQSIAEGDDYSRFCPPNRRMLPLGVVMPSHFSEVTGEIIVACDTSGSMGPVYPTVFGEIVRIAQHANPAALRLLWWDTKVAGEQFFQPAEFDKLKDALKPKGGGGTTVSCVADYVEAKKYKPVAIIMLTDGYIESDYRMLEIPTLWGIVDNDTFVPRRGKMINISSVRL